MNSDISFMASGALRTERRLQQVQSVARITMTVQQAVKAQRGVKV